jgi:hypothetical protein
MNKKKIIIFGTGVFGTACFEFCEPNTVAFFCDNNPEKVGQEHCGKKVISFEELKKIHSSYQIVIAVQKFYPIANQLSQNGIENYMRFTPKEFANYEEMDFGKIKEIEQVNTEIKKNKMQKNYDKNKELLSSYPYLFGKIPEFRYSQDKILNLDEEIPYFFKDLSKPLFICNLTHPVHIKYLFDNVRASEDMAMDNHIYMYYENERKFLEMLCQCNLKPLLKLQKFVFLLGKQNKNVYPINFKEKYGIDYAAMPFKPLRANELKRIILYLTHWHSGQDFLFQVSAANKNILPIFVPNPYSYLPKSDVTLKVSETFFQKPFYSPDDVYISIRDIFFLKTFRPLILQLCKRKLINNKERISPTILLDPHYKIEMWGDIYKSFQYRKGVGLIRNPITRFASGMRAGFSKVKNINEKRYLAPLYYSTSLFFEEANKYKCFKLESLKNNPIKGAKALCEYFQVPFDKNMLHPEKFSHIATSPSITGKMVMGFESTPKRDISEVMSEWDLQRLMPIFEPILKYYGYEYKKYAPLQEKNLRKVYSQPFLFEKKMEIIERNLFTEVMLYLYNLAKSGKYYLPPVIDID